MNRICRWILGIGAVAYVAALALLAIGAFGLFGQERDPLAGVFLVPLGLPWNLWLDAFGESLRPWLALATPAFNLFLISALCRLVARRLG